ncbi:hypothetical protein RGQ29_015093 [Quercus rubra]|uniref:Nudix hydrolase domain-containing protein n=1 Tax=Quercus rubra TaxID=3512 RepID=A0AAN7FNE3_QUERU|nr:hypothetical protein RGQ29_015093 [Quercus rubra]
MASLQARTGREKQRYEGQLRLVAGCIPYRLEPNVEVCYSNSENKLLVLMISSPNRKDLVFPKGGWEEDENMHDAACREALEEAGVKGILSENPLGFWVFRSKSRQNSCNLGGGCKGFMFALKVTEELDSWPEQALHERKWLTIEEAFKFCRYDWMRDALNIFLTTFSKEKPIGMREESVELPIRPLSDAGDECQMASSGCFGKPSSVQHLQNTSSKCIVQG